MKMTTESIKKISMCCAVLIIINIALIIFSIVRNDVFLINGLLLIIALACGLLYSVFGYKKSSANFYKLFMVVYSVVFLLDVIIYFFFTNNSETLGNTVYVVVAIRMLTFLCLVVLTFVKNLGKNISINLSLAILLINVILFVTCITDPNNRSLFILPASNLLLSFIAFLLVNGKYLDKEQRGAE